jgi:hypothetical protein
MAALAKLNGVQVTMTVNEHIVTHPDFEIRFGHDGSVDGHVFGHYNRIPVHRTSDNKMSITQRLHDWHPLLYGVVWYRSTQYNHRQGEASMDFSCTPDLSPIVIMSPSHPDEPMVEYWRGKLHLYQSAYGLP